MNVSQQIEELEARLEEARNRVEFGEDGATHEEMADAYEVAFDWADAVASRAIGMLRSLKPETTGDEL